MTRILGTIAAVLAALNIFLVSYPGDAIGQDVLLIIGAANVAAAAAVAFLAKPPTV